MSASAFAHVRQYREGRAYDAEVVGLELRLCVRDRDLLNRASAQVARVVDQDIDRLGLAQDLGDACRDRRVVRHVERDMLDPADGIGRGTTARVEDPVARRGEPPSDIPTDPRGAACHQRHPSFGRCVICRVCHDSEPSRSE